MNRLLLITATLLALACSRGLHAAETGPIVLATPDGPVRVVCIAARGDGPHPAVIVLSGSKGFGSAAYAEMSKRLTGAGRDVFQLHVLSDGDLDAIAKAGSARARIAYYATAFPRWTMAVHALVDHVSAEPHDVSGIGILGVSLGAEIAAEAVADHEGVRALVLVDGGFPDSHTLPKRALPPLMLIWGVADRVFPSEIARKLMANVQRRGDRAILKVYEGSNHDFFVQPGTVRAAAAQREAATFLTNQLK